ncbi:adenylate/guanylate cyclase domain-containing protein [Jiella sonneratiae]|uniref:Adenylate/guanylate cyclase domain-containing protein n=1 Tax=Jiella sonneratiae TaxID=2816856 RepID=A0ABS3J3U2_9HYPH|nr:adenylate/guanylate cyclase domain-containing protein [Jiella sonneratiae]MBO0904323.1 adenylate/guanylate cyclase domain-containing protein [Jiella sonneratiae]
MLKGLVFARGSGALPSRVAADILRFDAASERLTGWVQFALALFLLGLYFVAPKPVDSMSQSLVPVGLGTYLGLTLLRLYLSHRAALPRLFLFASLLVDVALLYALIWSFHLQYGQPHAFSLKAPTVLYVFVFIALRALRFDPIWVLLTGLVAAFGWLGLVLLAIARDGSGAITRSFVDYVDGTRILIGAEIDKIVVMVAVSAILAIAVARARTLVTKTAREQAERAEIRRFLPAPVEAAITASKEAIVAGEGVERNAAIVVLDIRGFSAFAAGRDPKEVVAALVSLHAIVVPVVEKHGGIVDKYLGDGMLATFGAGRESKTPAADALSALVEIVEAAAEWTEELQMATGSRLAVNGAATAGRVIFAALGDEARLEYTVIGEAVNLAAKMEKHNKVEATAALTTAATLEAAILEGYRPPRLFRHLPDCRVAGVAEPLGLVAVA